MRAHFLQAGQSGQHFVDAILAQGAEVAVLHGRLLHFFGLFLTFGALGAACALRLSPQPSASASARKLVGMLHGIGLLLVLVAGFGMLARLGVSGLPAWVWMKLGIWLLLGGSVAVVQRSERLAAPLLALLPLLGGLAAWIAVHKPGA